MTARTLLVRGLLVGVLAGLVAFALGRLLGESQVAAGIRFEQAASGGAAEPELVSRTVQSTIGLLVGCVVYGVALGGLLALAYAFAAGRLGTVSARGTAAAVAVLGFLALYALPALKYPSNPPGFNATSVTTRTDQFLAMLLVSLAAVIGATVLARRLAPRLGSWDAAVLAGLAGLVAVGLAWALLPTPEPAPEGFDPDVLWRFRIATTAVQASTWAVLGLGFGWLTDRADRADRARTPA